MCVDYNLHFLVSQHRSGKLQQQIEMRLRADFGTGCAGAVRHIRIQCSSAGSCAHASRWQQFIDGRGGGTGAGGGGTR